MIKFYKPQFKNTCFIYIKTQSNLLINLNFQICFFRPKKFTLKGFKRHYFVLKDLSLSAYRCQDDAHDQMKPRFIVNLKGCEVTPDVNISQHRYGIKLAVPSADGMSDLWLKCDNVSFIVLLKDYSLYSYSFEQFDNFKFLSRIPTNTHILC